MEIENKALIISTKKLSGVEQMALDLHLLDQTISEPEIILTLRFYHWDGDWLSIGYHQKIIPPHWEKLLDDGLIKSFKELGLNLQNGHLRKSIIRENCFGSSYISDLVDQDGYKRIGSAQYRKQGAFLQPVSYTHLTLPTKA